MWNIIYSCGEERNKRYLSEKLIIVFCFISVNKLDLYLYCEISIQFLYIVLHFIIFHIALWKIRFFERKRSFLDNLDN